MWSPLLAAAALGCTIPNYPARPTGEASADAAADAARGPADSSSAPGDTEDGSAVVKDGGDVAAADSAAAVPDAQADTANKLCGNLENLDESGAAAHCLCPLSALIDDPFDDQLPGAGGTNGGFTLASNAGGAVTASNLTESGGALRIATPVMGGVGLHPVVGGISKSGFAATVDGLTTVVKFGPVSESTGNGLVVALLEKSGWFEVTGGLELHVMGSNSVLKGKDNQIVLIGTVAIPGGVKFDVLSAQNYDTAALADGFVLQFAVDPGGWRYRIDGLGATALVASGPWTAATRYATHLGANNFVGVYLQGHAADKTPRKAEVQRLRVLRGRCTPAGVSCVDGGISYKASDGDKACLNCWNAASQLDGCCHHVATACGAKPACVALHGCVAACTTAPCIEGCQKTHASGVADFMAFWTCVSGGVDGSQGHCSAACK